MPSFSVATFNVHWGGLNNRFFEYDVIAAIRAIDADVLILQEVWWSDDGTVLTDKLTEYGVFPMQLGRGRRLPPLRPHVQEEESNGWFGVSILSRLPILDTQRIALGRIKKDKVPTRAIGHIVVDVEGEPFSVFGFHASRNGLLTAAVNNLARINDAMTDAPRLSVLGGDCNMWGPMVTTILRDWHRVVIGKTWPARHPHSQIDHLLTLKNSGLEISGEVLPPLGSDHLAVRCEISW